MAEHTATDDKEHGWRQLFADMLFWDFDGVPSPDSVRSAVGFMERVLGLAPGAHVLDLACGLGYHAIELARRGYEVTGLDWSQQYLEVARKAAQEAGVDVTFVKGDMAQMTFEGEFDAVVLWRNTFGMMSDEANEATLHGTRQALRQGGGALIDTQNYTGLPEKLDRGWSFEEGNDNLLFLTEGTRNVRQGRFGFDALAIDLTTGERHRMPYSWRLYLLPELEKMVSGAGMRLLAVYGDDPAHVDWKSWRRGEPDPYSPQGFTAKAAKRILLCEAAGQSSSPAEE
jgi:SAM-dependent methyltransferase